MRALKQAICLGIFFLLLVTTYNSFSYIITYIFENQEDGFKYMGPLILGVNYFTFLVANSFAPSIRLKLTTQMKIAALCYTANYVAQIFQPSEAIDITLSVLGAISGGFGAALLWVCYGAYVTNLCIMNNEEQYKGKYFAIVNGITFASVICGALVTTFCLEFYSFQVYFIILSCLGFASFLFCCFFIKDVEVEYKTREIKQESLWVQLFRSLKYYRDMVAVVPTIILDGLILAFVSSASSKLMPVGSKKLDVGIFLIIMGAGCIVGGYCSGHLSDILKMKNAGKLSIILIFLISTATALLAKHLSRDIAFILAVFWGIVRQFIEGWLYVACSRNYNGRLESFANMKQLHSLSFCIYMLVLAATKLELRIQYILFTLIGICPLCFFFLNRLPQPLKDVM